MLDPGIIRGLCLFIPILAMAVGWHGARSENSASLLVGGGLLATLWNVPSLLLLNEFANDFAWWSFRAEGGLLRNMPVDLMLGWAVLWGGFPAIALRKLPLWAVILLAVVLDVIFMPLTDPVVHLERNWLIGETAAVALCLFPAQFLARVTLKRRCINLRVGLQALSFGGNFLWVIPTVILEQTGGKWSALLDRLALEQGLLIVVGAFALTISLAAVDEFRCRGGGTPVPFDPPRRLVRSGPYAFLANPMQTGILVLYGLLGIGLRSFWVTGGGLMAFAFGAGLAEWSERVSLASRYGEILPQWRRQVRKWLPRWRPFSVLGCELRVPVDTRWKSLAKGVRFPAAISGLKLIAAPKGSRWEYSAPGFQCFGLAALARSLEHRNFFWALIGFSLRPAAYILDTLRPPGLRPKS